MILSWSQGDLQYHEEAKHNSEQVVPHDIYGKAIELCKIPTQTLDKVKELEERVQTIAKIALTYEKNAKQFATTINEVKKMLQEEAEREPAEESKVNISLSDYPIQMSQLTLKDEQFYREKMSVTTGKYGFDSLTCYSGNFPDVLSNYLTLGPFIYKQEDFDSRSIQLKTYKDRYLNRECVGIGLFKDGTNDLHGAGIRVDTDGDINEGYWEHGFQNGEGRYICGEGYYIGEFKDGKMHGQGTWFNIDGSIERSGKWIKGSFKGKS